LRQHSPDPLRQANCQDARDAFPWARNLASTPAHDGVQALVRALGRRKFVSFACGVYFPRIHFQLTDGEKPGEAGEGMGGPFMFTADLMKQINIPSKVTFVKLASYEGVASTGVIKEVVGLSEDIQGKTVVIVEDIVDTGLTMQRLLETLGTRNPKAIHIATLLLCDSIAQIPCDKQIVRMHAMPSRGRAIWRAPQPMTASRRSCAPLAAASSFLSPAAYISRAYISNSRMGRSPVRLAREWAALLCLLLI